MINVRKCLTDKIDDCVLTKNPYNSKEEASDTKRYQYNKC